MDEKLDELLELTRENHKILKKMHRAQVWSSVFQFMYWAVIIGGTIGLWYYFQPTIDSYMSTYQMLMGKIEDLGGKSQDFENLKGLLNAPILSR